MVVLPAEVAILRVDRVDTSDSGRVCIFSQALPLRPDTLSGSALKANLHGLYTIRTPFAP